MKVKNRNYLNHSNNKHILKLATTLCRMPIKKDVTFKKKLKSVKIFVSPTDENDLYGLRNKIVEKKPILKRHVDNTAFIKRKVLKTRTKIPKPLQSKKEGNVKKEILKEINKNESLNTSKTSLNTSLNLPKHSKNVTSISFVNSEHPIGFDASDKLKILEMYYQLKSFDIISHITGVNVNTLRYWKKTEDSIRKRADKDNLGDVSHSQIDFKSMIAEVKNEILLNKELPKRGRPKSSIILDQSLRTSHIDDIVSDTEIIHSSSKKALDSTDSNEFSSKSYLFENNVQVPSTKRGRPRRSAHPNMSPTTNNDSNTNRHSKTSDKQISDDLPLIESSKKGRPKKSLILNNSKTKSPTKRYVIRGSNKEFAYNSSKSDSPTKRGRKKSIIINPYLKHFPIRNKEQNPSPIELQMKNIDVNLAVSPKKRGRKKSLILIHHLSKSPIRKFVLQEKNQEQRAKSPSIRDNKTNSPKKRGRKKSLISNHSVSKSSPIGDNKIDSLKERGQKKSVLSNYLVSTPASQNKVNEQGDNTSSIDVQFQGENISIGSPKKRGRKKSLTSHYSVSKSLTKIPVQERDQEQYKKSSPTLDNKIDSPKRRGRKKSLPPNYSVTKTPSQTIVHENVDISIDSPKKRGRKKSIITTVVNVIPNKEEEFRDISSPSSDIQLENTPKKSGRKKSFNLDSSNKSRVIRDKVDDHPSSNDIKNHDTDGGIESPKKRGRKKSLNPNLLRSPVRIDASYNRVDQERKVLSAKRGRSRKSENSHTSERSAEITHQIDSPKKKGRKKSFNSDVSKSPNRKLPNRTMDAERTNPVNPESSSDRKKIPKRKLKSTEVLSKTAKKSIADSLKKTGRSRKVKSLQHSLSPSKSSIKKRTKIRSGEVAHNPDLKVDKSNTRKRLTSNEKNSRFIPEFKGIDEIVDEINKLSCIYNSSNCLNFLNDHFKLLSSEPVSTKSYDNTSIVAKTKLQDESFKNIISDFFHGEYKLLVEINHQFNQLSQKKYKNINKNLEELKNYFSGSIQRLQVLKQQLS